MGQMLVNNDEFDYNEEKAFNFQVLDPHSFMSMDDKAESPKRLRSRQRSGFLQREQKFKFVENEIDEYNYFQGHSMKEKKSKVRKSQQEFINSINKSKQKLLDNLEK